MTLLLAANERTNIFAVICITAAPQLKAPDILNSIPGLGEITALALLIDMPELGSMDAKQAASLAGLADRKSVV